MDCGEETGIVGAVDAIVMGAAAECACALGAFGAFGVSLCGVDLLGWNPGAAFCVMAVDAVAGWDGPFGVSLLKHFLGGIA